MASLNLLLPVLSQYLCIFLLTAKDTLLKDIGFPHFVFIAGLFVLTISNLKQVI